MPAFSSRIPSRTTTLLVVAAAHGLVLWGFWRVPVPVEEEAETFTSILFPLPATPWTPTVHAVAPSGATSRVRRTPLTPAPQPAPAPRQADTTAAIKPPSAVSGAAVDWSAQLTGAADSALNKEQQQRDQLGALTRKFVIEADPLNPGHGSRPGFRWYNAGTHRIDTRSPIPVLHLNDRCLLVAFILPFCTIGHIEIHGDLFQNMLTTLDENEATARPNDVP
jgi:hypothetical protein